MTHWLETSLIYCVFFKEGHIVSGRAHVPAGSVLARSTVTHTHTHINKPTVLPAALQEINSSVLQPVEVTSRRFLLDIYSAQTLAPNDPEMRRPSLLITCQWSKAAAAVRSPV